MVSLDRLRGLKIPSQSDIRSNPVLRMYFDHGQQYVPIVLLAFLAGAIGTVLSQSPQFLFGLSVETLTSGGTASQFPFADKVLAATPEARLFQIAVLFFGSYIAIQILNIVNQYFWEVFSRKIKHNLRQETYDSVQSLDMESVSERNSGTLMSIVNGDVDQLGSFPQSILARMIDDIITVITIGGMLIALNWQLAMLMLGVIPVSVYGAKKYRDSIKPRYKDIRKTYATLNAQVTNSIRGISTVKAYAAEDIESERVSDASLDRYNSQIKKTKTSLKYDPLFSLGSRLSQILVFIIGGFWVLNGPPVFFTESLTVGELTVFYTNSMVVMSSFTGISGYVNSYESMKAAAVRVYDVIDHDSPVADADNAQEFDTIEGNVKFEGIDFAYSSDSNDEENNSDEDNQGAEEQTDEEDNENALTDISFDVDAGQTVGLVGPSGSGKSTMMKLLLRFYQPNEGKIRVDGKDISTHTSQSLREHVGYVGQDAFVFDGTVRENITYGRENTSDSEVQRAIDQAGLKDVIDDLEDGVDTAVGEDGAKLSGGQRQRISIARALISDPSLLILDEATSHVDNITEKHIQDAINSARKGRTTFIIAHRLSTVRNSDEILVLDDGELVESGPHDELMKQNGLYAQLWNIHVANTE